MLPTVTFPPVSVPDSLPLRARLDVSGRETLPCVGIDGCPRGWAVAEWSPKTNRVTLRVANGIELLASAAARGQIGYAIVDCPIGLPDDGPRQVDLEARRLLGTRGVCVFPAPFRAMLDAASHDEASDICESLSGKRMSVQGFSFMPKVRELDEVMNAKLQDVLREGHPEVTFAVLNGMSAVDVPKREALGRSTRLALIAEALDAMDVAWDGPPVTPRGAKDDDVVDALAMLVSALRLRAGRALVLPRVVQHDGRGLRAEMVA